MTRNAKTAVGVAAASAPDTPLAGRPGPSAAAPPGGPAPAIVAALIAAPGATAAQLAQAAGVARQAAARELATLEKEGHATPPDKRAYRPRSSAQTPIVCLR